MSQQARRNLTRLLSLVVAVLCMGLSIFAVRAGKGHSRNFSWATSAASQWKKNRRPLRRAKAVKIW